MLYTKQQVQDNLRNSQGERVFYLAPGDKITDEAREYLQSRQIAILPATQARPERYELLCGAVMTQKPEQMTQLNREQLVMKNHPRIVFRGAMDTLEAALLLCQQAVPDQKEALQELLDMARSIVACDVLEKPLENTVLCGLTQDQQRQHSHYPQQYYGIPHFMPQATDTPAVLEMNRVRCVARQAELAAVNAFCDRDGVAVRKDILTALNRMSSMLYILMIRQKAKTENSKEGFLWTHKN